MVAEGVLVRSIRRGVAAGHTPRETAIQVAEEVAGEPHVISIDFAVRRNPTAVSVVVVLVVGTESDLETVVEVHRSVGQIEVDVLIIACSQDVAALKDAVVPVQVIIDQPTSSRL